jgi:hypothetical protein
MFGHVVQFSANQSFVNDILQDQNLCKQYHSIVFSDNFQANGVKHVIMAACKPDRSYKKKIFKDTPVTACATSFYTEQKVEFQYILHEITFIFITQLV